MPPDRRAEDILREVIERTKRVQESVKQTSETLRRVPEPEVPRQPPTIERR